MSKVIESHAVTVYVRLECDCGGDMRWEGTCFASNPPKYPHVCEKCGAKENQMRPYPDFDHKPRPTPGVIGR